MPRWPVRTEEEKLLAKKGHRDAFNKQRRETMRYFIAGVKASSPCADCGQYFNPVAMDFDHVRGEKEFNIGRMTMYNFDRLIAEMDKCQVVCANCHRIRSFA